jgi:integrase
MGRKKSPGITQTGPDTFVVQVCRGGKRLTRRVSGSVDDAEVVRAQLLQELAGLQSPVAPLEVNHSLLGPQAPGMISTPGSSAPSGCCPSLASWLTGRYAEWQLRCQIESTRRKLESPIRYLLASDLAELPIDRIDTAAINAYAEWRLKVGAITFATRKDGQRYRPRTEKVGNQSINKSLKVLSAGLRLAMDENLIVRVPKINFLPEDDARSVIPPTTEQYRQLIAGAEQLRPIAPLLPEVIELLGELGLRPGELLHLPWSSVDWHLGEGENVGAVRVEEQKRTRMLGTERWVPKNKHYRVVPFTTRAKEILTGLYERVRPRPNDLVIPNQHGLPYIRFDGEIKGGGASIWGRLREVSGVEGVTMRDLRHYFAVQSLNHGTPMSAVSAWMGHSDIQLTVKRYGRFAAEAKDQWRWARLRDQAREDVAQVQRGLVAIK